MENVGSIFETNLDVLIVGAGMSGIGMACYLQREMPEKNWAIVEAREQMGGTWDLFTYPGIRSDSDLFTFSYDFKPWTSENAIASADEIMTYVREAVEENDVGDKIHYGLEVVSASWDSDTGLWSVTLRNKTSQTTSLVRCRWLFSATGYYDYDQGFRPEFVNEDAFRGEVHHAQHWPDGLITKGKRIAVIGSGATAVTLVPALAEDAAHVVQVQRTPTYVVPLPQKDAFANLIRGMVSEKTAHKIMRWRNVRLQLLFFFLYQKFPKFGRWHVRHQAMKHLPKDYPYDVHFDPPYNPWDQRLCVVPDADLFKALGDGRASIVTGEIDRFCETGLQMKSGERVEADIIVLATGLNMKLLGDISLVVDGEPVDLAQKLVFNGMMLDGVPNYNFVVGYTNSSWTLKTGLLCQYTCNLLAEMDRRQKSVCVANRPDKPIKERPLMNFGAGYVQRSLHKMPKQGDAEPWSMSFNYLSDVRKLRNAPTIAPEMELSSVGDLEPAGENEA